MTNDPIADMLTRIRNANQRKHVKVIMPHSKIKEQVAQILLNEGFIKEYKVTELSKSHKEINILLKYKGKEKVISGLKRISKPGLRVYADVDNVPTVLNGYGIAILSTSKGIITNKEARKQNVGGEVLAYIW